MTTVTLYTASHTTRPALDTGISHAVVRAVGRGELGESLRLHRTDDILAFGRHDAISPGYRRAVRAAREARFVPIERLAGGRAAVFHAGTIAFAWALPAEDPQSGIVGRFRIIAQIMRDAFRSLDIDADIGELPGEYCPGAYSVHAEGRIKVMGVGQRLVRGAAHVGGVVSVIDGRRIREVLVPVYRELGIDWDPSTAGALEDVRPITMEAVTTAIVREFERRSPLRRDELPAWIVDQGARLAPDHISPDH